MAAPEEAQLGVTVVAVACMAFNRPVAAVTDSAPLAAGRAPAAALPTVIQPKPSERPGEAACQAGVPAPDDAGVPARQ